MKQPINIISQSVYQFTQSGPKKVVDNVIKGLNQLGIPYVLNKDLFEAPYTWIHDDPQALIELLRQAENPKIFERLKKNSYFFGPNIFKGPEELLKYFFTQPQPGTGMSTRVSAIKGLALGTYTAPSDWTKAWWIAHGYDMPLVVWPAGVDTDFFAPTTASSTPETLSQSESLTQDSNRPYALLYTKGRAQTDIDAIISFLNKNEIPFKHFAYGSYIEKDFKNAITEARFGIVVTSSESQGLAIEEMLSMNLPLVVFDIAQWNQTAWDQLDLHGFPATSVPYWDERCGLRSTDLAICKNQIVQMNTEYMHYEPRVFILEELNLAKQAKALCTFLKYDGTEIEQPFKLKRWRNNSWYRPILFAKYSIKYILRRIASRR